MAGLAPVPQAQQFEAGADAIAVEVIAVGIDVYAIIVSQLGAGAGVAALGVHQRGWRGENAGAQADIDVAAGADFAEADQGDPIDHRRPFQTAAGT